MKGCTHETRCVPMLESTIICFSWQSLLYEGEFIHFHHFFLEILPISLCLRGPFCITYHNYFLFFKEASALESFAKSLTGAIQDACSCILSATKISPSSSSIICSGEGNGKFVTKLRVKDKEEEKKIICGLAKKLKKGSVRTSGRNTCLISCTIKILQNFSFHFQIFCERSILLNCDYF